MKSLLICLIICIAGVLAQQYGPGASPVKTVYFENIEGGDWTVATNWDWDNGQYEPRTIDDVVIEGDYQVIVTLPASRVVRTLRISRGNTLLIESGVILVLQADALPCYPGNFVDPNDSVCKQCTNLNYQPLSDQSFCSNCGAFEQIPTSTRESCVCCPAGFYWGGNANATSNTLACPACPEYHSSLGECDACFCCPAGSSSYSGGLCFECPSPYNSHYCGECVLCLPSLLDTSCHCNNNGNCITNITDAFGLQRDVCQCTDTTCGFGPTCNVNTNEWQYAQLATSTALNITMPFPFDVPYNSIAKRSLPTGPILEFLPGTFAINNVGLAAKPLSLNTNFSACGYENPYTNPPSGFEATIFGFDLRAWDESNNAPIDTNITQPWWVVIPYDHLNVVNPFALHTFYWNTVENKWIDVTYTCKFTVAPTTIQNQHGTITGPAYQLSAQYHVFISVAEDTFGTYVGSGDGYSVPQSSVFQGSARPPTSTTGVTGVLPVPLPAPAPEAPVSAPVNNAQADPFEHNGSSVILPSIFALLVILFFF